MTFRKVPTKTEGLNTTRRAGDFLADNARPCLSDRCPTFADSKDYLTAYRDAGNEKGVAEKKRRHAKRNAYRSALPDGGAFHKNRQKAPLSTAKTRKIPLCKFDIGYTATGT